MGVMGTCISCGARCATAPGASGRNERAAHVAALASSGRVLAYEIESIERETKRPINRLICRDCLGRAVAEVIA